MALTSMDTEILTIDDVMRLKELLPSDTEAKSLSVVLDANLDSLHDTEKALFKLSKVTDCRGKLLTLIFILNFEGSKKHIENSCGKLKNGAGKSYTM